MVIQFKRAYNVKEM